jgi:cytochrome P450
VTTPPTTAATDPADLTPVPRLSRRIGPGDFFGDRLRFLIALADAAQATGNVGRVQFGTRTIVVVNDAEAVGEVLLTRDDDFHKGPALSIYSRPLLGSGLLTSEGEFHRRQRRLLAPAFAHKRVVSYAPVMAGYADRAQQRWRDGETLDLAEEMTRITLDIVGKTLFGRDDVEGEADELGGALTLAMRFFIDVIRSPLRPPFAFVPFWRPDVKRALARLDATIYGLVAERRRTGEDAGDLLSMLLHARDEDTGEPMPEKQIRDEAMTLFLAGHETTANALAWTWYLLAKHPAIYQRVQSEADAAVPADRLPGYDDLARMPYTLQVLKEAMRLYPPAYALARQAVRDTVVAGHRVPRRAIALFSPYLLHRDPRAWPDPERFDPDRFAPDAEKGRPRYSYLPFGGGPRICIGAAFALMEGHLILATLARRVTFTLADSVRAIAPEPLITLRPRGGVPAIVRRRSVVRAAA